MCCKFIFVGCGVPFSRLSVDFYFVVFHFLADLKALTFNCACLARRGSLSKLPWMFSVVSMLTQYVALLSDHLTCRLWSQQLTISPM